MVFLEHKLVALDPSEIREINLILYLNFRVAAVVPMQQGDSKEKRGAQQFKAQQIQLLKLAKAVKKAEAERDLLKEEVKRGNDVLREEMRVKDLMKELQMMRGNEANIDALCCFGAPNWDGSGSEWGPVLKGTEILHEASKVDPTHSVLRGGFLSAKGGIQIVSFDCFSRPLAIQLYTKPFSKGGLRMAMYARDADTGRRLVAKRALEEHRSAQKNAKAMHVDAQSAALSRVVAADFTGAVKGMHRHQPLTSGAAPEVSYLSASVAILPDPARPGCQAVYLLEPFLDCSAAGGGCWQKFSLNDGKILAAGEDDAVSQAFTHFSQRYRSSADPESGLAIVDVQGLRVGEGNQYTLTDPAVASLNQAYGKSDLGAGAVEKFKASHTCSAACRALARS